MAVTCLLVSLAGILVIDNDINAVHLARQRRLTAKQARKLKAVEVCHEYEKFYSILEEMGEDSSEYPCNEGLETGSAYLGWYYRSISCYDDEICIAATYDPSDPRPE